MDRASLRLIRKALSLADEGTPLKDAFESGVQEQETIRRAFQFVVEHHGKKPASNVRAFCND